MINEVYAPCPKCDCYGMIEIEAIATAYMEVYLDDRGSLEKLTEEQVCDLREAIDARTFVCFACGAKFAPVKKRDLLNDLFNV